jgi:Terminase RNaseH-like domain
VERFRREYGCEFITADESLINALTLLQLQGIDPIYKLGQVRWYEKIEPNKIYLVALDPSAGVGQDYSAIEVFSLPDMRQVAEWSHNRTSIPQQVKTMQGIIRFINDEMRKHKEQKGDPEIYYTLENNSWGESAVISIDEIGEENFAGTWLHEPRVRGVPRLRKGLNTNTRTKASACMKFKSLVESKKLVLQSRPLVRQVKFFVSKGNSFAGKSGENDDCVMATLLCIRMMQMVTTWDENMSRLMRDEFVDDLAQEPMPISLGY